MWQEISQRHDTLCYICHRISRQVYKCNQSGWMERECWQEILRRHYSEKTFITVFDVSCAKEEIDVKRELW